MTYKYLICGQQIQEDSLRYGNRTYGHRRVRPTVYLLHYSRLRRKRHMTFKLHLIRNILIYIRLTKFYLIILCKRNVHMSFKLHPILYILKYIRSTIFYHIILYKRQHNLSKLSNYTLSTNNSSEIVSHPNFVLRFLLTF